MIIYILPLVDKVKYQCLLKDYKLNFKYTFRVEIGKVNHKLSFQMSIVKG